MIREGSIERSGREAARISAMLELPFRLLVFRCGLVVVAGTALYGLTLGIWRSPLQACYTALKFPLVILLTCILNGAVNGMLARLLGAELTFRQTFAAILFSFAIAAVILAGLSPVTLFIWWNAPPLGSTGAGLGHSVMLLTHVFIIAVAGIVANRHLYGWLGGKCGGSVNAARVLFSWLAGNLFLGAQIAWNLRPFIGSPQLSVQFLRPDPMHGNFYEAVWRALLHVFA